MNEELAGLDQLAQATITKPEKKKPGRKPGYKVKPKHQVLAPGEIAGDVFREGVSVAREASFDLKLELFKAMSDAFPEPLEVHIKLLPLGHPKLANRRLGPHYYVQIKGLEVTSMVQALERRPTKDGGELEVPVMKPASLPLGICCLVPKDATKEDIGDYVDKLLGDQMRYQGPPNI